MFRTFYFVCCIFCNKNCQVLVKNLNFVADMTQVIPATKFKFFTSTWQFLLHITRELAVGNPSAIEGQTANILTSRTGLWARCSTSLLEFEKYLMSLLAETKRRVIPATKFKFFTSTWQFFMESRSLKKNHWLQRDSNLWPPRYPRNDALPIELWSHTLGARSL